MAEAKKKKRKIALTVALVLLVAMLLLVLVPLALLLFDGEDDRIPPVIHFADPALSEDIYADAHYMTLNQAIHYATDEGYLVKVEVPEADYARYSEAVQLLIRWVYAARAGDADAYNACFSPEYIAQSGPERPFTMQKIYDITITRYTTGAITLPEGYRSVEVYGVAYKIKDNNGSLRSDMGSDAEHEQFVSVVTDAEGDAYIYGVQLYYSRNT